MLRAAMIGLGVVAVGVAACGSDTGTGNGKTPITDSGSSGASGAAGASAGTGGMTGSGGTTVGSGGTVAGSGGTATGSGGTPTGVASCFVHCPGDLGVCTSYPGMTAAKCTAEGPADCSGATPLETLVIEGCACPDFPTPKPGECTNAPPWA